MVFVSSSGLCVCFVFGILVFWFVGLWFTDLGVRVVCCYCGEFGGIVFGWVYFVWHGFLVW